MGAHGRAALAVLLAAGALLIALPAAAQAYTATDLIAGLTQLDKLVHNKSSLSATQRDAVHEAKDELTGAGGYTGEVSGVTYADVLINLDCISTAIQHARNAPRSNMPLERKWANKALGCQRTLGSEMKATGKASTSALSDMTDVGNQIRTILARINERHVFGAKSTALRHFM